MILPDPKRHNGRLPQAAGPPNQAALAEGVGFEPTIRQRRIAVFKTAPFNHSGTPPQIS